MRNLVAVFFVLASTPIFAECTPDLCSDVYVDKLYVNAGGTVYIATSGDEKTLNCSAVSGVYVTLQATEPGKSEIYSTLLAAQSTGKKVAIQVADGVSGCPIQYVTLDRVQ